MIASRRMSAPFPSQKAVTRARPAGRTSGVAVRAMFNFTKKEGAKPDTKGAVDPKASALIDDELKNMMGGFIWDGSMQRWVRAKKREVDPAQLTVTPKSGSPYTVWPVMYTYLTQKGMKSCNIDQAYAESKKKNVVLLDVRLAKDFAKQRAEGAVNVPLFRITAGDDKWDKIKRVVMAGLFMNATERDPDFVENVRKIAPNKNTKIIVMCSIGGTLETVIKVASTGKVNKNDLDRTYGRESRSLKAVYELKRAGYKNIVHMEGGLSDWRFNGLPLEP